MRSFITKKLSSTRKREIKAFINKIKQRYVDLFLSYSPADLRDKLQELGIKKGDTVMVHSGWSPQNGFQGTIQDAIKVFKEVIGAEGNLLMVSMPYRGALYEYLENLKCFNVRRTSGRMGLMSEIFRRQKDVLRSLHPGHPVLCWGKNASWLVDGHENCVFSCGEGSPFEKMVELQAKVIFFDVKFTTFTFFHHIEHVVQKELPFQLYCEKEYNLKVVDCDGQEKYVKAKAFSIDAVTKRRPLYLEKELLQKNKIHWHKVGNTSISLVNVCDAIECAKDMIVEDKLFYEL